MEEISIKKTGRTKKEKVLTIVFFYNIINGRYRY